MLKKSFLYLPLLITPLFGAVSPKEQVKEEISFHLNALEQNVCEAEQSVHHFQLALAYCHDQEIDQAFRQFLLALRKHKRKPPKEVEPEEESHYEEALEAYLSRGNDPPRLATYLLETYGDLAEENPNYLHLNSLIATAHANLGNYISFFERFYAAFPYISDSFLAHKTQGILYLRLAQHGRLEEERHAAQKEAFHFLIQALERNPRDAMLYKVLIFLAKDEKNESQVQAYLNKMVVEGAPISRGDLYLFVREAVSLGEYGIGQKMIDQARARFSYSRALTAAQEYLNQHKG